MEIENQEHQQEETVKKKKKQKKIKKEKEVLDNNVINQLKVVEEKFNLEKQTLEDNFINSFFEENNGKYFRIKNDLFLNQTFDGIPFYEKEVRGLVFIGDPHIWSKRPGRRLDENFTLTILNKLKEIVDFCNKNNYLAIFKGDIFEQPNDNDISMLIDLIEIFKSFKFTPISLVGNHDIKEWRLTKNEPLKLLEKSGCLILMEDNGFAFKIKIKKSKNENKIVLLGGTPYGQKIPDNVFPFLKSDIDKNKVYKELSLEQKNYIEEQKKANSKVGSLPILLNNTFSGKEKEEIKNFLKEKDIDSVIWLTHHDLAMNGAYPNSIPLKEILGVDYVVNGHIHNLKTSVLVGETCYYNKGNIARTKIDLIDHKPAVWVFDPFNEEKEASLNAINIKKLIPFYLTIKEGKDIFRLNGKHLGKDSLTQSDIDLYSQGIDIEEIEEEKIFASLLLQANEEQNNSKTDDGIIIKESLAEFIEQENMSNDLKELLVSLANRATNS